MKKKLKEKYRLMGKVVLVAAKLEKVKIPGKNNVEVGYYRELILPRPGWVVGYTKVFCGTVEQDSDYNEYSASNYSYRYLKVRDSISVVLIRFWPTEKPIKVFIKDIEETDCEPYHSYWVAPMTEKDKKWLSEDSRSYPRDKKGRFCKYYNG